MIWVILLWIAASAAAVLEAIRCVHMLQLESYKLAGYRAWVMAHTKSWLPALLVMAAVGVAASLLASVSALASVLAVCAGAVIAVVRFVIYQRAPKKKPLVYTQRVQRLLSCYSVLALVQCALILALVPWFLVGLLLLPAAIAPFEVLLAAAVMQPAERGVQRRLFNEAKTKLARMQNTVKIGITGSYGKTSAKFALGTILSERFKTVVTPQSYNTPMGVTRVIREQLDDSCEVFVSEMGARFVGDIAEMCDLVGPRYGLITSVGPQHLETFGSQENVNKTKYELIDALPEDGVGFFPHDGDICDALYEKTQKPKVRFGFDETCDIAAEDIQVTCEGSAFTLVDRRAGGRVACSTKLLGRHNIQNILGACAVARALGMSMEEIARGVAKIAPVEHRLQLLPPNNGITVIDDAFNANPVGTRMAMEVLAQFPGRRIVITPGMVELGAREAELNEAFGAQMAKAADIAILIGKKRSEPIARGLQSAGFDAANLHVVGSLDEASALLATLSRVGDVVLFENDLPDQYEE
nr:UDP-N-acetylmuramoyl-tripeptide--D-alanyl-D-alanine ligase [Maliibacterium massiliense]